MGLKTLQFSRSPFVCRDTLGIQEKFLNSRRVAPSADTIATQSLVALRQIALDRSDDKNVGGVFYRAPELRSQL